MGHKISTGLNFNTLFDMSNMYQGHLTGVAFKQYSNFIIFQLFIIIICIWGRDTLLEHLTLSGSSFVYHIQVFLSQCDYDISLVMASLMPVGRR